MTASKIIGIDLGGTSIKFGILTLDGEVQDKWSIPTNILEDGKHIVPDIIESINHPRNGAPRTVSGGEPSSTKQNAACAAGLPVLSWLPVRQG